MPLLDISHRRVPRKPIRRVTGSPCFRTHL
ncbi:unnamed protein product [Staurois parvus]|uniref:Uncharacterized protein n=1 Tax=Staurois parvus TaxID=386267 RepID=A0ABN9EBJ8_9NEOB|nr:unnamed protein product [Staurois parvus]